MTCHEGKEGGVASAGPSLSPSIEARFKEGSRAFVVEAFIMIKQMHSPASKVRS